MEANSRVFNLWKKRFTSPSQTIDSNCKISIQIACKSNDFNPSSRCLNNQQCLALPKCLSFTAKHFCKTIKGQVNLIPAKANKFQQKNKQKDRLHLRSQSSQTMGLACFSPKKYKKRKRITTPKVSLKRKLSLWSEVTNCFPEKTQLQLKTPKQTLVKELNLVKKVMMLTQFRPVAPSLSLSCHVVQLHVKNKKPPLITPKNKQSDSLLSGSILSSPKKRRQTDSFIPSLRETSKALKKENETEQEKKRVVYIKVSNPSMQNNDTENESDISTEKVNKFRSQTSNSKFLNQL